MHRRALDSPARAGSRRAPSVAVVTGASAGLGRAIAHEFARQGIDVGLIARSETALEATADEVRRLGARALVVPADVANAAAVDAAAEQVEAELGPIDVWVNNAMVSVFSPVDQMAAREYLRVTEVTYLGAVYGTLSALRRMKPRDRGTIVQVGSALAYRSIPLQSAYCASKHAVQGFTESLRCELLHDRSHVQVTMVQLPALNTPQFDWVLSRLSRRARPVAPIFRPELAARAVVFASLHPRRELCVGGSTVVALLAQKLAPGLADRYLAATGYEAQQTDQPEQPDRPNNLFSPPAVGYRIDGRFETKASDASFQFWLTTHRAVLAAGAGVASVVAVLLGARAAND